jgi:hypothetical protein
MKILYCRSADRCLLFGQLFLFSALSQVYPFAILTIGTCMEKFEERQHQSQPCDVIVRMLQVLYIFTTYLPKVRPVFSYLLSLPNESIIRALYIVHSPITSRWPTWLFGGSVLIWHMYQPRSLSLTFRTCRYHVRWSLCVTLIRWFFVITWLAIVRIVYVSKCSHTTYRQKTVN